jgi:hypothetical protein
MARGYSAHDRLANPQQADRGTHDTLRMSPELLRDPCDSQENVSLAEGGVSLILVLAMPVTGPTRSQPWRLDIFRFCPVGTSENSPAVHCRENTSGVESVPKGRLNTPMSRVSLSNWVHDTVPAVPSGLDRSFAVVPGSELPGYSRVSLRDVTIEGPPPQRLDPGAWPQRHQWRGYDHPRHEAVVRARDEVANTYFAGRRSRNRSPQLATRRCGSRPPVKPGCAGLRNMRAKHYRLPGALPSHRPRSGLEPVPAGWVRAG